MEHSNQRSWFAKNWGWVLPVGCCSGCLIILLVFGVGVGAAVFSVFKEMKEMSPLEEVLVTVNENDKAKQILGGAIVSEGFPNGNISIQNGDGDVDYSIGVKGSKGTGTLYALSLIHI